MAGIDKQGVDNKAVDDSQDTAARLTAYVLDELGADERAAVEAELAASETARQQIAEIRRSVELVTAALSAEPMGELSAEQRLRLVNKAAAPPSGAQPALRRALPLRTVPPRYVTTKYVLAATLLLCVTGTLAVLFLPAKKAPRDTDFRAVATNNLRQLEGPLPRGEVPEQRMSRLSVSAARAPADKKANIDDAESSVIKGTDESRPFTLFGETQRRNRNETRNGQPSGHAEGRVDHTILKPTYEATTAPVANVVDSRASLSSKLEDFHRLDAPVVPTEKAGDALLSAGESNTESYNRIYENPFLDVRQNPLSTFSIDVDTASYANIRRFLNGGSLPPKDAVRIEEMLNYFTYQYAPPADDRPFAVHAEVAGCPWEPKHRLLRIALKGREIDLENRPASNLVFLIDVSGSMDDPAKLPLLKSALHLLVDKLGENDRVAMVVYAGSSGLVLPSTSGLYKETILAALDRLQAGGSTNGGSGIQLAYQVAREKFIQGGTNRVILCTDGDFNVGVTDQGSLTRMIEDEAKSGVFLSVLGFGAGNLKDSTMEGLADRGNGNYAYIDTLNEARKVLVEQLGGTLVTIAKDVKLQIEFNPRKLDGYRLIGYENRLLRAEDFNDDKKDAGEIGAGHTVTALYELVPAGAEVPTSKVDELKYQRAPAADEQVAASDASVDQELLTLKLRYKEPDGDKSKLIESVVKDAGESYARASEDLRFAGSVAGFGLLLRDSQYKGDLTWAAVLELAQASRGNDANGYRAEFIELVKKAAAIAGR